MLGPERAQALGLVVVRHPLPRGAALLLEVAADEEEPGGEAEGERLRRAPLPPRVGEDGGDHAHPRLHRPLQGDVEEGVADEGVGEAVHHLARELLAPRHLQPRDDLGEERALQIAPHE